VALRLLLSSVERVVDTSKRIVLSAGLLTLASNSAAAQPKIQADPRQSLQKSQISKFSAKYLLRAAAGSLSMMARHGSHSSHSSHSSHYSSSSSPGHTSHSSHSSHYSSSYPTPVPAPSPSHSSHSSHSSHYSSSGPATSTIPGTTVSPRTRPSDTSSLGSPRTPFGFSDGFDGSYRTSTRWVPGALNADDASYDSEVVAAERNGRLEIAPRADAPGRHFNGYLSAGEWNFTDAKAAVEVVQAAESADTVFAIGIDSDNWYGFVAEEGTLYLQSKLKGVKSPKSIPYNAAKHRFWRFRLSSADNTITWETSPDGQSWEPQRVETLQMDITAVHVTLSAGTYKMTKAPGTAIFDNFRLEH
jgi:hypothetical protein